MSEPLDRQALRIGQDCVMALGEMRQGAIHEGPLMLVHGLERLFDQPEFLHAKLVDIIKGTSDLPALANVLQEIHSLVCEASAHKYLCSKTTSFLDDPKVPPQFAKAYATILAKDWDHDDLLKRLRTATRNAIQGEREIPGREINDAESLTGPTADEIIWLAGELDGLAFSFAECYPNRLLRERFGKRLVNLLAPDEARRHPIRTWYTRLEKSGTNPPLARDLKYLWSTLGEATSVLFDDRPHLDRNFQDRLKEYADKMLQHAATMTNRQPGDAAAGQGGADEQTPPDGPVPPDRYRLGDFIVPDLTKMEFKLLDCLASAPHRTMEIESVIATLWPDGIEGSRTVCDKHRDNLNKKLLASRCGLTIETANKCYVVRPPSQTATKTHKTRDATRGKKVGKK